MANFNSKMSDINEKLKHLSLFTTELAQSLIPQNGMKYTND